MKRVLLAAVAASLFAAPSFAADSASSAITFSGDVENTCVLEAAAVDGTPVNANLDTATSVDLTDLVDDTTAVLNASSITLKFADSYCNYAHDVDLDAANGGLIDTTHVGADIVGGSFVTRIGYSAVLNWAGADQVTVAPTTTLSGGDTIGSPLPPTSAAASIAGANRGDMVLTFAIAADNPTDPVLAGAYSETLTVEMGPSL